MAILKLKTQLHQHKSPLLIRGVNIERIVISNRVPLGKKSFKNFIGYEDDSEIIMHKGIRLPKMGEYRKDFEEPKYMSGKNITTKS